MSALLWSKFSFSSIFLRFLPGDGSTQYDFMRSLRSCSAAAMSSANIKSPVKLLVHATSITYVRCLYYCIFITLSTWHVQYVSKHGNTTYPAAISLWATSSGHGSQQWSLCLSWKVGQLHFGRCSLSHLPGDLSWALRDMKSPIYFSSVRCRLMTSFYTSAETSLRGLTFLAIFPRKPNKTVSKDGAKNSEFTRPNFKTILWVEQNLLMYNLLWMCRGQSQLFSRRCLCIYFLEQFDTPFPSVYV